jgi:hypothetical protein
MTIDKEASTSIFVFQDKESLSGFAGRVGRLTNAEFLAQYPEPHLLTSMPTEAELLVWSVLIPIRKKKLKGVPLDKTISRQTKVLWDEVASKADKVFLGRGPECDIVLAPKSISRKHVVFERRENMWHIADLGSTNGTKLDGTQIAPKTLTPIRTSPVKISLGTDVTLWFILPDDLHAYVNCFARQLSDTSKNELPSPNDTKVVPSEKTPAENSMYVDMGKSQVLQKQPSKPKPTPQQIANAEAETGPLVRSPEMLQTWDDETDERSVKEPSREPTSYGSLTGAVQVAPSGDPDHRLVAAIRAIAALDSLILTVSVKFRTDDRIMVLYSPQVEGRVTDVADQLVRLGPLIRSVIVTLSLGDGKPVEIYSS